MAKQEGIENRKTAKRSRLNYFFLNGILHKKLLINRGADTITAWNYPEAKKVMYNYSDVLRKYETAFTTRQVCQMVNRGRLTIDKAVRNGSIEMPQFSYSLDENRNKAWYFWREKDIMDLLAYLATVHRGRPRNDGEITPEHLPTPRELRAMINSEQILYVKSGDTFVPSWRAKEF